MNISYVQSESNDINQLEIMLEAGAEPGIFVWGGPSTTLIHLLRQLPHIYIYTYTRFFIIYTHFLFDKLYIYTKKKRSLVFSIKIICDGDLS